MADKLLIVHGGGPTAVLNCSLYGAVAEARRQGFTGIFGAVGGARGMLTEDFYDLGALDDAALAKLLHTPGSALGTSRFPMEEGEYAAAAAILKRRGIGTLLYNGGNGSMDACGKLSRACRSGGINVVGIPKTIDNDIAVTDHTPGYGSAALYLAASVQEVGEDLRSLPIHVCVVEAMGRNAGWLTAASALARKHPGDAPHLIYTPEIPFDQEEFLTRVEALYNKLGGVMVVASEGLRDKRGAPVVSPVFTSGRSVYYGDVSAHLAQLVIQKLGGKARSEKPGLLGRCSAALQSPVDRREAVLVGEEAVRAALAGQSGVMVALRRRPGPEYGADTFLVPVEEVMLAERRMPAEFLGDVTGPADAFLRWCSPLLGRELPDFFSLNK